MTKKHKDRVIKPQQQAVNIILALQTDVQIILLTQIDLRRPKENIYIHKLN